MASKLALLLVLCFVSGKYIGVEAATCKKYSCPPPDFKMPKGTCVSPQESSDLTYVSICTPVETTYCNVATTKCQVIKAETTPSWPGEPCSQTDQCVESTCQNKVCKGRNENFPCTSHEQCDPGLRCDAEGFCKPLLETGASGCLSQYDCVQQAACNTAQGADNGVCVVYGGVADGGQVSDCENSLSQLCQSGVCQTPSLETKIGECLASPKSEKPVPQECSADEDCLGTNGQDYFYTTCQCGYNLTGQKYCNAFLGDDIGRKYLSTLRKAVGKTGICNTTRRFAKKCLELVKQYAAVRSAEFGYQNYAFIQGNDECIKMSYTRDYWKAGWRVTLGLALLAAVLSF